MSRKKDPFQDSQILLNAWCRILPTESKVGLSDVGFLKPNVGWHQEAYVQTCLLRENALNKSIVLFSLILFVEMKNTDLPFIRSKNKKQESKRENSKCRLGNLFQVEQALQCEKLIPLTGDWSKTRGKIGKETHQLVHNIHPQQTKRWYTND